MELNQTEIGFTEASLLKQGYHLQLNARRSELDPESTGEFSSIPVNEGSFVFESHRPGSAAPKVVKYTTSASPRRPSEVSTQKWQINSGILRNGLIFTATTRTNQGRLTTRHTYSFTLMTGDNSSLEKATEITFHIDTLDERRRHSIDAAVEFAQGIQKNRRRRNRSAPVDQNAAQTHWGFGPPNLAERRKHVMAFHKGNVPLKKSGATREVRMRLKKGDIKEITIPKLEELMTEMGLEFKNRKVVSNILLRLLQSGYLKKTDVYDGRYKVYTVVVGRKTIPNDEKPSYPKQDCRKLSDLEINPLDKKAIRELEVQLLFETQNNEDLEAQIQGLMTDYRREVYRLKRLLKEDRSTIESLKNKVEELEAENQQLRLTGRENKKVDMSIFNLSGLTKLKGEKNIG